MDDVGAIIDEVTRLANTPGVYRVDDCGVGPRRLIYNQHEELVGDIYFDPDRATVTATKMKNFDGNFDMPVPDFTSSGSELYCDPDFFKKILKLVGEL